MHGEEEVEFGGSTWPRCRFLFSTAVGKPGGGATFLTRAAKSLTARFASL